jgi:F0F1-type ATP synthase beta subunit
MSLIGSECWKGSAGDRINLDAEFPRDICRKPITPEPPDRVSGEKINLYASAAALGGNRVRAVGTRRHDSSSAATKIIDTGSPITVPVGEETLGRVLTCSGIPSTRRGGADQEGAHTPRAPEFDQLQPNQRS